MGKVIGIDLGTTNSLIGAMEAGFPILFSDELGRRLTPSVVYFPQGGDPIVGYEALKYDEAIFSVKRLMGRKVGESQTSERGVGVPGEPVRLLAGGRIVSPEDVSAAILRKLKRDAERSLGTSVDRAVITVPAYFNDAQRAATKRAGEAAGFVVERLLAAEPLTFPSWSSAGGFSKSSRPTATHTLAEMMSTPPLPSDAE